jgi:hypothetical protein
MDKAKILLQLDTDSQPSVFDSVVAIDGGNIERLLRHHGVTPKNVRELVHGAIFSRGPDDLRRTAIFVGGSDVGAAEAVLAEIQRTFFGPLRVSVMLDPCGSNTTAAAAVLAAAKHVPLEGAQAVVLAATGPVGQRVVRLLAGEKATVRVASRNLSRAQGVCDAVTKRIEGAQLSAHAVTTPEETAAIIQGADIVFTTGAAGVELLPADVRLQAKSLKVAIDVNAVPPHGIGGIEVIDRATDRNGVKCYGAIGVGNTKMRIHKLAIQLLFQQRDLVLDAEELFELGRGL